MRIKDFHELVTHAIRVFLKHPPKGQKQKRRYDGHIYINLILQLQGELVTCVHISQLEPPHSQKMQ